MIILNKMKNDNDNILDTVLMFKLQAVRPLDVQLSFMWDKVKLPLVSGAGTTESLALGSKNNLDDEK